ncbi:molybdate ABC transporter substrate-binding protein [Sporomusa sp. KB1]|uniref:molybdate ABC transporter substrate-binding protein n=1 Tax=Sporomusa sp. KB1 TaxID=943346 RepID=UPI001C94EC36|nr:molybdate ABC transporter substrate-binding protein [Sporomusa sp. KB1]
MLKQVHLNGDIMSNYMSNVVSCQYKKKPDELDKVLRFVPSSIGEALLVTDLNAKILFMNSTAENLTGYLEAEVLGTTVMELFEIIDTTTGKVEFPTGDRTKKNTVIRFGKNTSLFTKHGKEVAVYGSVSHIMNDAKNLVGYVIAFFDMTEQRRRERVFKDSGMRDNLTGLYNRSYFTWETTRVKGKQSVPVGLIMCDIDGLKIVNDTLGHNAGDNLLSVVAMILKKSFHEEDIVARIGGDEFAILLFKSSNSAVSNACRRIRKNIAEYNEMNAGLPLSVSLGYAVGNNLSTDISKLIEQADRNMYKEKQQQSRSIKRSVVNTIMRMIGTKDFITQGHCERVKNLMEPVALSLGLSEESINELKLLAEFHDIGKVGIADRILLKPGTLTDEERNEMQRHCEIGQQIAMAAPDLAHIANGILKHHEWWNGTGYPQGIKGEIIPIECRILAVADAYDAMTNDRPYRKAMAPEAALAELKKGAGIQFDPVVVVEFTRMLGALKVYAAASVKDALLKVKRAYIANNPERRLLLRFGGSGELKQQIEDGALADVFISAAHSQMNQLQEKKMLLDETRIELLQNRIVLIASKNSDISCNFQTLTEDQVKKIAVGNPESVPAGKYAQELLMSLGIFEIVKAKLIIAKDVRQVLAFVETENIDVGIVYQTDAQISKAVKILDRAPLESCSPVVYPVAVMKDSNNIEASKEFIKFLTEYQAREIFKKYGFTICGGS